MKTNQLSKKMSNWLGFQFSSGGSAGEDYLAFQRTARADLRAMCKQEDFVLSQFNKNHYVFSAVLQDIHSGQYIYVSIPDVRYFKNEWVHNVLIRTMSHAKDWTGGRNHRCGWADIAHYARCCLCTHQ